MLKRNFAVVLVAGLVLGGGAVALAGDDPARPTLLAAQTDPPPSTPGANPATRTTAKFRLSISVHSS